MLDVVDGTKRTSVTSVLPQPRKHSSKLYSMRMVRRRYCILNIATDDR